MPIFTRRRLQAMLDELALSTGVSKLKDLRSRLENKRVEQSLPAEMELSILWALSKLGSIEVEPKWYENRRPDACTKKLFEGRPCAVEITAISDARLSQEEDMRRVARRLCELANKIRKGQGKHLHFQFGEESGYADGGYVRRRKIDKDFAPTDGTIESLKVWLKQDGSRPPFQLVQGKTHVVLTWRPLPLHPHSNFFCTMPAEAYSLEDNPLYEALEEKRRQLVNPQFEGLRCIIVADAGCRLLHDLDQNMRSPGTVTGSQIIDHFLRTSGQAVDLVLVLSPYRNHHFGGRVQPVRWRASIRIRPELDLETTGLSRLIELLPPPRFEGYQARSLQLQAAYRHDAHGWYVGTTITLVRTEMTIKISARALLDLLAGRITLEQFQHFTGLADQPTHRNIFAHRLDQGDILSNIRIEPGGLDEDDDWLLIDLKQDPSAAPLQLAAQESQSPGRKSTP